jgi:hypothetical protein
MVGVRNTAVPRRVLRLPRCLSISHLRREACVVERFEAHRVLVEHLPVWDWRWLWLRARCRECGERHPCPLRSAALDELAGRDGPGYRAWWSA